MLFESLKVGPLELPNRALMAPMTRSRAGSGGVPGSQAGLYYAQRAEAGLIVTEGVQPSAIGQGYMDTPGLHTAAQVEGWREVTGAVHAAGGRIFAQLLHTGRVSHPDNNGGLDSLAPSAVPTKEKIYTRTGLADIPVPREMSTKDVEQTVSDFVQAARNAVEAGFDGVELHGANGYLIHQFLAANTNRRNDSYGGSVAGRLRFAVEVAEAVSAAIGAERVGFRMSPENPYNEIEEPDAATVYPALVDALPESLAYVHLIASPDLDLNLELRKRWAGVLVVNATHEQPVHQETIDAWFGRGADALSFGRAWLANPDLLRRLTIGAPLNDPDPATFFGGDHRGYVDYPVLTDSTTAS
ncbi:alkene reductase [Allorhizocola rhizosphaerae]|uniref:alkene reductase n=1 Tax=Allorhizocola rhizosphaerae TaxID=1872709 RepID=UPI001B8C2F64|nr:alkene reductase [Allorhizocola rhizosphaerae]